MKTDQKGNTFVGILILIGIIWMLSSLFSSDNNKIDNSSYSANSYSGYSDSSYDFYGSDDGYDYDLESENPYNEGSGHYAGYEWAMENEPSSCDGNSQSFIEGCEEYMSQLEEDEEYSDYQ